MKRIGQISREIASLALLGLRARERKLAACKTLARGQATSFPAQSCNTRAIGIQLSRASSCPRAQLGRRASPCFITRAPTSQVDDLPKNSHAAPRRHERKTRNSRVAPALRPPRTSAVRQGDAPAKCDCSIKTPRRTKNRCSKKRVPAPNTTTH